MFSFGLFSQRMVQVRLRDGSRYLGYYRLILPDGWSEAKPTLWLTDWSDEHMVPLDRIAELEAA
ncbi:MAG TPA: hypothetical protein VGZ50_09785 [Actinomycetota bacterium]|nr:hypothetical protein [Actinomycetota bacterium]